ncbi:MAG: hypothetical protein LBM73_02905 [Candidatus Nomurabacteria bacterium]|jgi:hypothetical protein|nr:hypothetical protein [Candidatus Nomurabacteria bacterium]
MRATSGIRWGIVGGLVLVGGLVGSLLIAGGHRQSAAAGAVTVSPNSGTTSGGTTVNITGYRRAVDYIKLDSNQVFDTGVIPGQTTSWEIKTAIDVTPAEAWYQDPTTGTAVPQIAIGARTSVGSNETELRFTANSDRTTWHPELQFGSSPSLNSRLVVAKGEVHTYKITPSGTYVDGAAYAYDRAPVWSAITDTLQIGWLRDGAGGWGNFEGNIYGVRIWDGSALIRDYVPYVNNAGTVGLYDEVNQTFLAPLNRTGSAPATIPATAVYSSAAPTVVMDEANRAAPCTVISYDATSIQCATGAHPAGTVNVQLGGGAATTVLTDAFTYKADPDPAPDPPAPVDPPVPSAPATGER